MRHLSTAGLLALSIGLAGLPSLPADGSTLYAGLFTIPLLILLSLTGIIDPFKPQRDVERQLSAVRHDLPPG